MDSIDQAVQLFDSLRFKRIEGREPGVVEFLKRFEQGERKGSYAVFGSYNSQDGQYNLKLCAASFIPPQVEAINTRIITDVTSPDTPEKRHLVALAEEACKGIIDDAKKELGIPDDVDIGRIGVSVDYSPEISFSGSDPLHLYAILKSYAEKLGYTL